jgi:hypothetical protein
VTAFDFAYFALPFISLSLHHVIAAAEIEEENISSPAGQKINIIFNRN